MGQKRNRSTVELLQEFSLPLIAGVFVAMAFANFNCVAYESVVHTPIYELPAQLFSSHNDMIDEHLSHLHATNGVEHFFTLHFLINDIFMVLFFGIAAKEITEACLPGGSLNPISKAINPLLATVGGVVGPVGVFFLLNAIMGQPAWINGWGIPTATDIALAWLVGRFIFGKGHPAVSFLLLLAVADDAIGLAIIALAYPDPSHPTIWANALWIVPGMLVALILRVRNVQSWIPYIAIGGSLAWWGLYSAHLHPALALVFIVPFLPGPKRDYGLFEEETDFDESEQVAHAHGGHAHSPLERFEHQLKLPVDFGLFLFAFVNAGVPLSGITSLTWIVLLSLLIGKTAGITAFSMLGERLGCPLPQGMNRRQLVVAAMIAGIGLTVALFVSAQAFADAGIQGAAKMGALFSGAIAGVAILSSYLLGVKKASSITQPAPIEVPLGTKHTVASN